MAAATSPTSLSAPPSQPPLSISLKTPYSFVEVTPKRAEASSKGCFSRIRAYWTKEYVVLRMFQSNRFFDPSPFRIRKMEVPEHEWRITRLFRMIFWVRIQDGDREIYLNIGSLSKRFFLSKSQIRGWAARGILKKKLVQDLSHRYLCAHVNQITSLSEMNKEGIRTSIRTSIIGKKRGVFFFIPDEELKSGILISKLSRKKLLIIRFGENVEIGKGRASQVFRINDLFSNQFYAMKVGDIKREVERLQLISQRGITGAQAPPIVYGEIPEEYMRYMRISINNNFYIGELFTSPDLFELIAGKKRISKESCLRQLWNQYQRKVEAGIYHSDLKLENVFVDDNGVIVRFSIGDWEGAQDLLKNRLEPALTATPQYVTSRMLHEVNQGNKLAALAHDRFGIGNIFYMVIVGLPPRSFKHDFPTGSMITKPLEKLSFNLRRFLEIMNSFDIPHSQAAFDKEMSEVSGLWRSIVDSGELKLH